MEAIYNLHGQLIAFVPRIKKSVRDRRYYSRHRERILARKRLAYAADPSKFIERVARYKQEVRA
jgi:hypothetical protein